MMELQAVKVTESATSPRASMEKTLLELPPGLHAMSMMPKKKKGVRWKIEPTTQAMRGQEDDLSNDSSQNGKRALENETEIVRTQRESEIEHQERQNG